MPSISRGPVGSVQRAKLPFPDQIEYFRDKLELPTDKWDDIRNNAHDRAFIAAGATKAELISDLRAAVDAAIAKGASLESFRKDFDAIVARHGWAHTGSRDWRSRVIYETNLATSYAAGRYQQLTDPDLIRLKPYWQYKHNEAVAHPRPLHVAWDGVTLPANDPWFAQRFPPNGWGCRCRIVALSASEAQGQIMAHGPDDGTWTQIDRQGNPVVLPNGVDYGWDHTPGRTWQPDLEKYHPAIAAGLVGEQMRDGVFARWHEKLAGDPQPLGEAYPVAVLAEKLREAMGIKHQALQVTDRDLLQQFGDATALGPDRYARLQSDLAGAKWASNGNTHTATITDGDQRYDAKIEQTKAGLYLRSLRRKT